MRDGVRTVCQHLGCVLVPSSFPVSVFREHPSDTGSLGTDTERTETRPFFLERASQWHLLTNSTDTCSGQGRGCI